MPCTGCPYGDARTRISVKNCQNNLDNLACRRLGFQFILAGIVVVIPVGNNRRLALNSINLTIVIYYCDKSSHTILKGDTMTCWYCISLTFVPCLENSHDIYWIQEIVKQCTVCFIFTHTKHKTCLQSSSLVLQTRQLFPYRHGYLKAKTTYNLREKIQNYGCPVF